MIIAVGLLIVFVTTSMPALASPSLNATKNQENNLKESLGKQATSTPLKKSLWGVSDILVTVKEVFGTVDNPQYRNLPGVKVIIRASFSGIFYLFPFSRGRTDGYGEYGVGWNNALLRAGLYDKVIISKIGYHTYKCKSYQTFTTPGGYCQFVYFTMAKNGSPFT